MALCVQLCLDLRFQKLEGAAVFQGLFGGSGSKSGIAVALRVLGLTVEEGRIPWFKPKYYPRMTPNGASRCSGASWSLMETRSGFGEDFSRPPAPFQHLLFSPRARDEEELQEGRFSSPLWGERELRCNAERPPGCCLQAVD